MAVRKAYWARGIVARLITVRPARPRSELFAARPRLRPRAEGLLAFGGLLVGALAVRLAVLWVFSRYQPPWLWEVERMAQSLVRNGTLAFDWFGRTEYRPTAFLPPVYPLVVAAAMWLGGDRYQLLLQLWQALISTGSVGLLVPIAYEMTGGRRAAFLAGAIAALYPTFVVAPAQINTVALEVLWIELFALGLLLWARTARVAWIGMAGMALGLATLTRGPALLIWPIVAFWALCVRRPAGRPDTIRAIVLFTLCTVAPMLPWAARNYAVLGSPVPIATNAGYNFWVGHNELTDGQFDTSESANWALVDRLAPLSEPDRDAFYWHEGWTYIFSHPSQEVGLSLRKLAYFVWFRPSLGSSYWNDEGLRVWGERGLILGYGVVLVAAIAGIWLSREHWRKLFFVYGIWGAYAASAVAFFVATRYRAPVEPFLVVFAGLAADRLLGRLFPSRQGQARLRAA